MEYSTQMDAARKGILTKEMKIVAEKEHMDPQKLMDLVAKGQVVIPAKSYIRVWIQTELVFLFVPRSM